MTSNRIARDYLVRESQDVVELVRKGALRFVGVEPPKRHDTHHVVEQFIGRFPDEWRQTIGELSGALTQLAQDRAPAFYGKEAEDIPASELFGETEARRAMAVADRLLALYRRLLGAGY